MKLIDERTNIEYYIGISINYGNINGAYWQIKKIWKENTIWKSGFANGNQSYVSIWNNRYDYTYS
jgi:hypothetical protein